MNTTFAVVWWTVLGNYSEFLKAAVRILKENVEVLEDVSVSEAVVDVFQIVGVHEKVLGFLEETVNFHKEV